MGRNNALQVERQGGGQRVAIAERQRERSTTYPGCGQGSSGRHPFERWRNIAVISLASKDVAHRKERAAVVQSSTQSSPPLTRTTTTTILCSITSFIGFYLLKFISKSILSSPFLLSSQSITFKSSSKIGYFDQNNYYLRKDQRVMSELE